MPASPEAKAAAPAAPKKDRSPNYPAIGPKEALGYAELIWKRDKRNPVSVEMACQHIGYKAKNGASLTAIAALKRYGLLTVSGSDLRVSDDANTIFLAPVGHPEREALIKKCAMLPALFSEVLKSFPDGLPSDENLRFRLRKDWEFANDKAADNFIKSLREAVALAGVAGCEEITDTDPLVISEEQPMTHLNPANTAQAGTPPARFASPPAQFQGRSWDLGAGVVIAVSVPPKLSKGNIEKLKKYVSALELEASISWEDVESE